jgi:hypothetical protein
VGFAPEEPTMGKLARVFALLLAFACFAAPASAQDQGKILDGLKDKVSDWLKDKAKDIAKDKAKDAAEDWLLSTEQTATMKAILNKCQAAMGGTRALAAETDKCLAAVKFEAISVLGDINTGTMGKDMAKLSFDTLTKLGSLVAGGAGAAAEGGLLGWVSSQYSAGAQDAALDKLQKFLFDNQVPAYDIFETEGTINACTYKLRAVWDIVHGTYKLVITGDCHCQVIGDSGHGIDEIKLGTWWVTFDGKLKMVVDGTTVSWEPEDPIFDWDAQCNCNNRTLRQPYTARGTTGQPVTTPGTGTPGPGKAVPPQKGQKVCAPCQPIQDKIDAAWDTLDQIKSDIAIASNQLKEANANLGSDQGTLADFKKNPGNYGTETTEASLNGKIRADQDACEKAQADLKALDAKQKDVEKQLIDLGIELKNCIAEHCGEHGSVPREYRSLLPGLPEYVSVPQRPVYVANPGTDVAKNDVVLTDTSTQKEIPGGKVVIIPGDPKQPISPPIQVTSTGTVTLPQTQPNDRIVFLPDNHAKIELNGGDLPKDGGERITVPERPLRLIVHDTPCGQVTDSMVRTGITDQYGVGLPSVTARTWDCADYRFGTDGFARNDSVVTIPHYVPLKSGTSVTDGGTMIPKDGPTITDGGTVIEGDQPREIQSDVVVPPVVVRLGDGKPEHNAPMERGR